MVSRSSLAFAIIAAVLASVVIAFVYSMADAAMTELFKTTLFTGGSEYNQQADSAVKSLWKHTPFVMLLGLAFSVIIVSRRVRP